MTWGEPLMRNRPYLGDSHPLHCTCKDCIRKRLELAPVQELLERTQAMERDATQPVAAAPPKARKPRRFPRVHNKHHAGIRLANLLALPAAMGMPFAFAGVYGGVFSKALDFWPYGALIVADLEQAIYSAMDYIWHSLPTWGSVAALTVAWGLLAWVSWGVMYLIARLVLAPWPSGR